MRHRLVVDLGSLNDEISAIQVGSEVRVAVYRHQGFAGSSTVFSSDTHSVGGYWNDEISSLIVFPKRLGSRTLDAPLGISLGEASCYTVTGYSPVRAFYPLPEREKETEASYGYIGDYMDDHVFFVTLYGEDVEAELFWERDFTDPYTLTFPRDGKGSSQDAMYHCPPSGPVQIDLTHWYPWAVNAYWQGAIRIPARSNTQSLKVRWIGTPPSDTRSTGGVPAQPGSHIVEPSLPTVVAVLPPDISGIWQSSFHLVYEISQDWNRYTWYVAAFHETGTGTIDGTRIDVAWSGDNGSGQDTGTIILDAWGNPLRIEWSNGNVFYR